MRVSKDQFEYYTRRASQREFVTVQRLHNKAFGCEIRRFVEFSTNSVVAASIDDKQFYVKASSTQAAVTTTQKTTRDFIGGYIKKEKKSPTIHEVAAKLKIKLNYVHHVIQELIKKGYITKVFRAERGFAMVPQECPVCNVKTEWPYDHVCG